MRKKVLILEDNLKTLTSVKAAIERAYNSNIKVYAVDNYLDACGVAFSERMDVFVLDIMLAKGENGDTSGVRFAQELRNHVLYMYTPIIFLTALSDPGNVALHKFHCYDYLEKPFPPEKLAEIVGSAVGFLDVGKMMESIMMRKDGILYVIEPKDIIYVEVDCHVLYIHKRTEVLSIQNRTLKQFLKQVSCEMFIQCSRHAIVNCEYIEHIDTVNHYITLKDSKQRIEVSRNYMKYIRKYFEKYGNKLKTSEL